MAKKAKKKTGKAVAVASAKPPAERAEPKSFLEVIYQASRDPKVDDVKFGRFLVMQKELEDRDAERGYGLAMNAAQSQMPVILRNKENPDTHSKFANLETVQKHVVPIATQHGFSLSFGTADSPLPNHYRITCTAMHIAGHKKIYFADFPADDVGPKGTKNKTLVQGIGSMMSYARRYLILLIFNITLAEEDNDGVGQKLTTISAEQEKTIDDLIAKLGAPKPAFLKALGVSNLSILQASRFEEACRRLQQWHEAQLEAEAKKGTKNGG